MTDYKTYFGKENIFVTGRATAGLYLIFLKEGIRNKKVLFPANICYAPVFAAVLSGNIPVFVDIDDWANTSLSKIKNCINGEVACIVLPHMYGKVVKDVEKISCFCHDNGILFVEDCASAFGASFENKPIGSFGDYSIFSFDYSKIVDIGFGGIVASNKDLSAFEDLQKNLPYFDSDIEISLGMFSKIYRIIRNTADNSLTKNFYAFLPNYMSKYFLFKLNDKEREIVLKSFKNVEEEKIKRWKVYNLYVREILENSNIEVLKYEEGDIPWRFSFKYKGDRKDFVSYLLDHGIPISDWYPFIGNMFGVDKHLYKNTTYVENIIYNLPLSLEENNCIKIINSYLEKRD